MIRLLSALAAAVLFTTPLLAQETPKALQEAFLDAVSIGDVDAVAALYSHDTVYYPMGSMEALGKEGVVADWAPFFETYDVISLELIDPQEEVVGDTAIAWGLWAMTFAPKAGGASVSMEGRFMDMSKKIDGRWLYVVDHVSVPFVPPKE